MSFETGSKGALRALAVALALGACGGDDDGGAPGTDAAVPIDAQATDAQTSTRGTIEGTVTYSGSGTGRLTIGVWPTTPPAGPPVEFFARNDATFPIEYELSGLAPGSYYLGVVLDIGSNNSTIPGAEDPQFFPTAPIVIEGGDTHTVDVALADPGES